jgi:SAM-dependent methyltransferase
VGKFASPRRCYAIKPGYVARTNAEAFDGRHDPGVIHQPDVYAFAAHLARQFGSTHIIDIGCGVADKLASLHPQFQIVGIDMPGVIADCKRTYPFGEWIAHDLNSPGDLQLEPSIVRNAVVVCADVIEHLRLPEHLLAMLHGLLHSAQVVLVSTPDRDLVRGVDDDGPPANRHHAREWNSDEFQTLLLECGFNLEFIGLTLNNSMNREKRTILAALAHHNRPKRQPAPPDFAVVAIIKTFNEADVIASALQHLIAGGIDVYLIDNWSTDGTVEIARSFLGRGLIHIEQFPDEGRSDNCYHWGPLLKRTEEVAATLGANWYIHHDADEYRESPWLGLTLRDGLHHADRCGFNAVDFTVVNFPPVDDTFAPGSDFVAHFSQWEFGRRPGHFQQVKCWKNLGQRVNLTDTGGHRVGFCEQRVYPYKFLLRHYSFRTQAQAHAKVHDERVVHPSERGAINGHYASMRDGGNFLQELHELPRFDETFYGRYMVERLSGIGIVSVETAPIPLLKEAPRVCTTPNQHAPPAELDLTATAATFNGYQDFVLTRHRVRVLPTDLLLARKYELLSPVFLPRLLTGRTVLDLGANSAFFSFLALQNGASAAAAVDIDPVYTANVNRAARGLGFELVATDANVADWQEPGDVVIALALVHWLHNCTASFGTLGTVVQHLARLARHALVVEWVDPEDPAIEFFGHLRWSTGEATGPYTREIFDRELSKHFARVELIGEVSPTRRLFIAFKPRHEIDLGCPLPLLHPAETVISCRMLTVHGGVEYWSRVYDLGASVLKQTSGELASREALVLAQLPGASVPRVVDTSDAIDTSTVTLEKIAGQSFEEAMPGLVASEASFRRFLAGCLDLLTDLADAHIVHRDLHQWNLLIKDGRPVLLDFGWATAPGLPIFTPEGLFGAGVDSSDVHALGRLLLNVCPTTWPARRIVATMAHDDPGCRIDDPRVLRSLLDGLDPCAATTSQSPRTAGAGGPAVYDALLTQIERRDREIAKLRQQQTVAQKSVADGTTFAETELALAEAEQTVRRFVQFQSKVAAMAFTGVNECARVDVAPALRAHALAYAALLRRPAQPAEALALARQMLRTLSPHDDLQSWLAATYLAGSVCLELGRHDEALEAFHAILALDATRVTRNFRGGAFYHAALALEAQGLRDAARSSLTQCLEHLPEHRAARVRLEALGQGGGPV